jgi:transposase
VGLYKAAPAQTHVICVDEMGPVSAKTYFSRRWSAGVPRVTPDYGRRGYVWVFGAFEPSTGLALTHCAAKRNSANFVGLLDQVEQQWPHGDIILIMDNLSIHKAMDVRLWALAHKRVRFLFQPTYAPWLNLIEPWWKTLRSLALKGRRFETTTEVETAIYAGTVFWNQQRHPYSWRKAA